MSSGGSNLKYVSRKRPVREDKRFVMGKATFAQDVNLQILNIVR